MHGVMVTVEVKARVRIVAKVRVGVAVEKVRLG